MKSARELLSADVCLWEKIHILAQGLEEKCSWFSGVGFGEKTGMCFEERIWWFCVRLGERTPLPFFVRKKRKEKKSWSSFLFWEGKQVQEVWIHFVHCCVIEKHETYQEPFQNMMKDYIYDTVNYNICIFMKIVTYMRFSARKTQKNYWTKLHKHSLFSFSLEGHPCSISISFYIQKDLPTT